jgi:hypothetical protein
MVRFLARRLLLAALTLFAVSVLTFLMFFALPRDPATAMCPKNCDAARLERVRNELGLNDAKAVQYSARPGRARGVGPLRSPVLHRLTQHGVWLHPTGMRIAAGSPTPPQPGSRRRPPEPLERAHEGRGNRSWNP